MPDVLAKRQNDLIEFLDRVKSLDPDRLEKALNQFERMLLIQAESEAADAMSAVQGEIKQVLKTRPSGLTNVRYADIGQVMEELVPIYTKHGFSLTYDEHIDPRPEFMHFSCTVRRGAWKAVHNFYPRRDAQIKGQRTWMQEGGSNITYARRYLAGMAFNIVSAQDVKEDNDAGRIDGPLDDETGEIPCDAAAYDKRKIGNKIRPFLEQLEKDVRACQTKEGYQTIWTKRDTSNDTKWQMPCIMKHAEDRSNGGWDAMQWLTEIQNEANARFYENG